MSIREEVSNGLAPRDRLDPFAATLVVVCCLSWGLNQVAIKVVNTGLQPAFQAGLRSLLGLILVVGWCWLRGIPLFQRDRTFGLGIAAGILFALEFLLIFVALDFTSVSRGVVFLYSAPFVVALGAHFLIHGERLTAIRVTGFVGAFAGLVFAFADELSLPSDRALIGDALCVVAGIVWGLTTLLIKKSRLTLISGEKVLAYQLAVSAVLLLPLSPLFGPIVRGFNGLIAVSFAYQVIGVVAASYVAWFWLLRHYPASQLAAFTFLSPIFGVMFGGFLLSEPLTVRLLLALVLVAGGIYLVNRPAVR